MIMFKYHSLFILTGDAISRYWKSSVQFSMVQTLFRISFNSRILTESDFSLEIPQFGAGKQRFKARVRTFLVMWDNFFQVAKLTGHHYRVLYLAMSPDGEAIVTGAGDETLRFWNVFSKARSQKVKVKKFFWKAFQFDNFHAFFFQEAKSALNLYTSIR